MSTENKESKTDAKQGGGNFTTYGETLAANFDRFVQLFLDDIRTKYNFPDSAINRLDQLLHYTCLGGKCYRGGLVLNTVKHLCQRNGSPPNEEQKQQAMACAWAIEALQACFLVADDVMDASSTRRGKPCWYKIPEVQLDAVNDSLILESFVFFLVKHAFGSNMAMYCAMYDLYRETSFQTQLGQMLDLTSQPQGVKDPALLTNFTLENYTRIITYKTAFYSFYLPIAAGLIICGCPPETFAIARDICIQLGVKFQIQDDFLDCFGDFDILGKIGTDIKDHKLTWLCAMALSLFSAEQRQEFERHYGHEGKEDEDAVRALYEAVDLPNLYLTQEQESFDSISSSIASHAEAVPPAVFREILDKIHLRQK